MNWLNQPTFLTIGDFYRECKKTKAPLIEVIEENSDIVTKNFWGERNIDNEKFVESYIPGVKECLNNNVEDTLQNPQEEDETLDVDIEDDSDDALDVLIEDELDDALDVLIDDEDETLEVLILDDDED